MKARVSQFTLPVRSSKAESANLSLRSNKLLRQFSGFLAVGMCNTLLDFSIFNLLTAGVGLKRIPANVVSVSCVLSISFILNARIVFQHPSRLSWTIFARFVGVTAFSGLVLQNSVIYAMSRTGLENWIVREMSCRAALAGWMVSNLSKALAVGIGVVWNFSGYKWLVFTETGRPADAMPLRNSVN